MHIQTASVTLYLLNPNHGTAADTFRMLQIQDLDLSYDHSAEPILSIIELDIVSNAAVNAHAAPDIAVCGSSLPAQRPMPTQQRFNARGCVCIDSPRVEADFR